MLIYFQEHFLYPSWPKNFQDVRSFVYLYASRKNPLRDCTQSCLSLIHRFIVEEFLPCLIVRNLTSEISVCLAGPFVPGGNLRRRRFDWIAKNLIKTNKNRIGLQKIELKRQKRTKRNYKENEFNHGLNQIWLLKETINKNWIISHKLYSINLQIQN